MMPLILIVDDDIDDIRLYTQWLSGTGVIRTAANGHDGWISMRNLTPDLLVVDLLMPVMDGHQLLRLVHADPIFQDIPVILNTGAFAGLGSDKDAQALRKSVDIFLFKPVVRRQFVDAAEQLLFPDVNFDDE